MYVGFPRLSVRTFLRKRQGTFLIWLRVWKDIFELLLRLAIPNKAERLPFDIRDLIRNKMQFSFQWFLSAYDSFLILLGIFFYLHLVYRGLQINSFPHILYIWKGFSIFTFSIHLCIFFFLMIILYGDLSNLSLF